MSKMFAWAVLKGFTNKGGPPQTDPHKWTSTSGPTQTDPHKWTFTSGPRRGDILHFPDQVQVYSPD